MTEEFISRAKALSAVQKQRGANRSPAQNDMLDRICRNIKNMPAADVAEVVHGRWCASKIRSIETVFYCSECKRTVTVGNDFFGEAPQSVSAAYPYCHCGAKMDGAAE